MAIEAIIGLAVRNLHDAWIYSNFPISPIVETTFGQVMEKLVDSLKILGGTEADKGSDLTVDDWKIKFLQAVYLADDAIHTFLLNTNLQRHKVFIKFPFLRSSKVQFRFSNEMKKCLDQLTDSMPIELRKRTSDENPEHNFKWLMPHYDITIKYCEVLDEKLFAKAVLANSSGKTTLVKRVYNHSEIKKIFHNRAWVCVSLDFKEKNLLVQILKQVTEVRDEEKLPLEKLQEKLHNLLNTQRYLIVLDDVHTPAMWEKLQVVFPISSNGSRVILTIRDPDIATHIDPAILLLRVRPLTEDESWSLFLKKARTELSKGMASPPILMYRKCTENKNTHIKQIHRQTAPLLFQLT
ncbi:probable disease resistance protein At1g59620 [Pistacia vera]|uniref:probable disease resistance protein At1g59620 n=1 Tax=Pistacia vera TaxID=55513 RepID=UPI0012636B58|nr:probable disease resistance protein At1g59620 [Pistacia vera]